MLPTLNQFQVASFIDSAKTLSLGVDASTLRSVFFSETFFQLEHQAKQMPDPCIVGSRR